MTYVYGLAPGSIRSICRALALVAVSRHPRLAAVVNRHELRPSPSPRPDDPATVYGRHAREAVENPVFVSDLLYQAKLEGRPLWLEWDD
jgi:hypothetical protein